MATFKSQQLLQTEEAQGHNPLSPSEHGQIRALNFEFNTTDDLNGGTLADNDTVNLVRIPAGYRIIEGVYGFEAMGANVTADIGLIAADGSGYLSADGTTTADDIDWLVDGDDVSSAGVGSFVNTFVGSPGAKLVAEKDYFLSVKFIDTVGSNAAAADKDFNGVVYIAGI